MKLHLPHVANPWDQEVPRPKKTKPANVLSMRYDSKYSWRLMWTNVQELIKQSKNDEDSEKRSLQHALKEIEVRATYVGEYSLVCI